MATRRIPRVAGSPAPEPARGPAARPASAARGELTDRPLDAAPLVARVSHDGAGALATFHGTVRDHAEGQAVVGMEYEAHPTLAARMLQTVAEETAARWPECRVALVHRVGKLNLGEPSVIVAVSAPHRAEAFDACRWAIDRVKEVVPIWKREILPDGARWVDGRRVPVEELP